MNILSSFSLFIILAAVVPGMITLACLSVACMFVYPDYWAAVSNYLVVSDWLIWVFSIAVMFLNQFLGIGLEWLLKKCKMLPFKDMEISSLKFSGTKCIEENVTVDPDEVYKKMYCILGRLRDCDDRHGHVQRVAGQFFLMVNTMISFILTIAFVLMDVGGKAIPNMAFTLTFGLSLMLLIAYFGARIRFKTMIKVFYNANEICINKL
jgi:hypothetical protein